MLPASNPPVSQFGKRPWISFIHEKSRRVDSIKIDDEVAQLGLQASLQHILYLRVDKQPADTERPSSSRMSDDVAQVLLLATACSSTRSQDLDFASTA
jgi:hypothetical protein